MKKIIVILFMSAILNNSLSGDNNCHGGHNQPIPDQTSKILAIQPLEYIFCNGGSLHYGLDLQQTAQYFPELVTNDINGNPLVVNLQGFIPILIALVQQLLQDNQNQQKLLEEQDRKIEQMRMLL